MSKNNYIFKDDKYWFDETAFLKIEQTVQTNAILKKKIKKYSLVDMFSFERVLKKKDGIIFLLYIYFYYKHVEVLSKEEEIVFEELKGLLRKNIIISGGTLYDEEFMEYDRSSMRE
jgi:hypothetical protein